MQPGFLSTHSKRRFLKRNQAAMAILNYSTFTLSEPIAPRTGIGYKIIQKVIHLGSSIGVQFNIEFFSILA